MRGSSLAPVLERGEGKTTSEGEVVVNEQDDEELERLRLVDLDKSQSGGLLIFNELTLSLFII